MNERQIIIKGIRWIKGIKYYVGELISPDGLLQEKEFTENNLREGIAKNSDYFDIEIDNKGIVVKKDDSNFQRLPTHLLINKPTSLRTATSINNLAKYAKDAWGVKIVDLSGLDPKAIKDTFIQMQRVMRDFEFLVGRITEISKRDKDFMGYLPEPDMSGCRITFNTEYYRKLKSIKVAYEAEVSTKGAPSGTEFEHAGVHELGHDVNAFIVQEVQPTLNLRMDDWNNRWEATNIVNEAFVEVELNANIIRSFEEFGESFSDTSDEDVVLLFNLLSVQERRRALVVSISTYAVKKGDEETIAEAFADWYANGDASSPLSKSIMSIIRRRVQ